jgi:hypothetical protein
MTIESIRRTELGPYIKRTRWLKLIRMYFKKKVSQIKLHITKIKLRIKNMIIYRKSYKTNTLIKTKKTYMTILRILMFQNKDQVSMPDKLLIIVY